MTDEDFIPQALLELIPQRPKASKDDSPVFLLGCGWCSGVLEVQDLLANDVWFWGEPFERCGIVEMLVNTWRGFRTDWPPEQYYLRSRKSGALADKFIANLYPPKKAWVESQRALLDATFKLTGKGKSAERWGIREVRWGAEHAALLRLLYPACKIVVIYRNPYAAFSDYFKRRSSSKAWWYNWPEERVGTQVFAEVWRKSVSGFLKHKDLVGVFFSSYEELSQPERLLQLKEYCGLKRTSAGIASNSQPATTEKQLDLTAYFSEIEKIIGATAETVGYPLKEYLASIDQTNVTPQNVTTQTETPENPEPVAEAAGGGNSGKEPVPPIRRQTVVIARMRTEVAPEFQQALEELQSLGYEVRKIGSSSIDMSRSIAVTKALVDGFKHLLFIESDVVFLPAAVDDFVSHQEDIVCGFVPSAMSRGFRCAFMEGVTELRLGAPALCEVELCDLSFTRINRTVFQDVQRRFDLRVCNEHDGMGFVPFFKPLCDDEPPKYYPDDVALLVLARRCGFRIYGDQAIRLGEISRTVYSWEEVTGPEPVRHDLLRVRIDDHSGNGSPKSITRT